MIVLQIFDGVVFRKNHIRFLNIVFHFLVSTVAFKCLFLYFSEKHSLPDVTASTGINVANTFSNDSVMKKVRGGLFK